MRKALLLSLATTFLFASFTATMATAQMDGAALLDERCSVCHPADRPKSKQKTPEQWETTVSRMMGKGAKLTEEEKQILLDHLSKTYKP